MARLTSCLQEIKTMDIDLETLKFKDDLCQVFNTSELPITNKKLIVDELARQVNTLLNKIIEDKRKEQKNE